MVKILSSLGCGRRAFVPVIRRLAGLAFVAVWSVGVSAPALAAGGTPTYESHAAILHAASSYAIAAARSELSGAKLSVTPSPLDSRLALPACGQPLSAFRPDGGAVVGNTVIGVRCSGVHPWTLYVPVRVSARLPVVVAARPLTRGVQLSTGDLRLAVHDLGNLAYGYLTAKSQALGQVLTRQASAGQIVLPGMLAPPILVKRGQNVTLVSTAAGIEVSTEGVALASGARGQWVKVRNTRSHRVIDGVVVGPGRVSVDG